MHEPSAGARLRHAAPVALGGLTAGVAAGTFGVGGGVLLVPLLTLVLRRSQHVAHATSLVAITLAAATGVARFAVDGAVAPVGAALLAAGAITGARLGARWLPRVSETGLRRLFGATLLVLAVRFVWVGAAGEAAVAGDLTPEATFGAAVLHLLGGLAAGVTSAVLGVGGGVILVPLMVLGLGYGQHVAEGTSLAVIAPTAVTGAYSHHRSGYTDVSLGVQLGVASMLGSLAGASFALSLDPVLLGRLYGGLQLVVGLLMLRRTRPPRPGPPTTTEDVA